VSAILYGNDGDLQSQVRSLRREVWDVKEGFRLLERNRQARWAASNGFKVVLGKSNIAPIPKATAGTFTIFEGVFPSESGAAAETLVGVNRIGYIGLDKWLIAIWIERNQNWYIINAEC
jgi:hypothetical protein